MKTTINFDMDGTIADLYGVENWLDDLIAESVRPYAEAEPLVRLSALARKLNSLQKNGYSLSIISWTSKSGTEAYNAKVTETKLEWLNHHMPSVHWDEIHIVPYGTPKQIFAHTKQDILFDDEEPNRKAWTGTAYNANNIFTLKKGINKYGRT